MELNFVPPTEAPGDESDSADTNAAKPPGETRFSPAEVAQRFPHLEILECLGRGGMGIVYKARQTRLNRFVALKILPPEKERNAHFSDRFGREAQTLARLSHPSIVAVYDFGEADGLFYLLMEFVDGVSLRHLLRSHKLTPEEALAIVPKICDALQYAHDRGVVHRDIKPENILLDREGQVKIADFGIAKIVRRDTGQQMITQEQQVIGTPHYMAPEQVEHPQRVDHRADIYSLGVVFYEMLTGELPLGKFAPPSQRAAVDVRLDEVVLGALEKEPDQRYQQASEVKNDVETIVTSPSQPQPGLAPDSKDVLPKEKGIRSIQPMSGWTAVARWTARALGMLMLVAFVVTLATAGMMPIDRLTPREQLACAAWGLALLGSLLGWKFEGTAALMIGLASAFSPIARGVQLHPFVSVLPFCTILAVLYAFCWWTTHTRETRFLVVGTAAVLVVLGASFLSVPTFEIQTRIPPRDPNAGGNLIDLTVHYNAVLSENWMAPRERDDNLGELPTGIQKLAGTDFDVRGVIQVEQRCRTHPHAVSGIAVGQKCRLMHFLHAARNAALFEDGIQIGSYFLNLANGTREEIPLVLGRELVDWRIQPRSKENYVTAWTGQNPHTRAIQRYVRLFKTTWENPFPEVEVQSVDFVSACPGPCPFLVALTVE